RQRRPARGGADRGGGPHGRDRREGGGDREGGDRLVGGDRSIRRGGGGGRDRGRRLRRAARSARPRRPLVAPGRDLRRGLDASGARSPASATRGRSTRGA